MSDYTLEEFYKDLHQGAHSGSEARQDYLESEFLLNLANDLEGAGVIDGFEPCHYRRPSGGMRVDGYWFKEEESALDIFILDFENRESLETLTNTEIKSTFKRLENFFTGSIDKHLYNDLEETSQGYGLSRDISDRRINYSKVNLYLISERKLSGQAVALDDIQYLHWNLSYHIWDMSRFYRQQTSRGAKEDLVVDLKQMCGKGLQCLPAHLNNDDYESYLLVMPADVLSDLYGKYGARLLEQNVRCFLQARGNVNKGIRATIMNDPGMFFAYNNGITATAKEVITSVNEGGLFIEEIRDLQIVNGGQTTASLFHTNKKDKSELKQVFVQMKLSVVDEKKSEEVVPKISEYANTQNKVNAADFFSNHPFHVRMEEFSRRLWAPPMSGGLRDSKWFYERARGQYADAQSKFTQAGRKKFQAENPKLRMFTKTDLAKFENVWDEKPTFVNFGAQKNFAKYATRIGSEWEKSSDYFNEFYFKRAIARAILFKRTEKLVSAQPWYQGGYRANIVAYTLAMVSEYTKSIKRSVDFMQIWKSQDLTPATVNALEAISEFVSDEISCPPAGISNISEWCKKDACWTRLQNKLSALDVLLPQKFISELITSGNVKEEVVAAKKTQRMDNGIEAQTNVLKIPGEKWATLLDICNEKNILTPKEKDILYIAAQIPNKIPSEKQSVILLEALKKAALEGVVVND
jgi:hypothetical protein